MPNDILGLYNKSKAAVHSVRKLTGPKKKNKKKNKKKKKKKTKKKNKKEEEEEKGGGGGLTLFSLPDGGVYNSHTVDVLIILAGQNSPCYIFTLKVSISKNVSATLNKTCCTYKKKNKP